MDHLVRIQITWSHPLPQRQRSLGRCVREEHLTWGLNTSETTSTVSSYRKGKCSVMKLTGRARPGQGGWLQGGPGTSLTPSLTITAAGSLLGPRKLRASLMASTCRRDRVTGLGGRVGAEMLQTTVPRNSRFCSHILLRTLAFLSEYWAHWQKSFYMHR